VLECMNYRAAVTAHGQVPMERPPNALNKLCGEDTGNAVALRNFNMIVNQTDFCVK
jgi:hypothetical protein